jgi:hypothetical protein
MSRKSSPRGGRKKFLRYGENNRKGLFLILTTIFFDKRLNRLATVHFARKAYIFTLISAITGR